MVDCYHIFVKKKSGEKKGDEEIRKWRYWMVLWWFKRLRNTKKIILVISIAWLFLFFDNVSILAR